MEFKFIKENRDENKRKAIFKDMKQKYPDKIPIVIEKDPKAKMKDISKTKYLIPRYSNSSEFFNLIRKKIEIEEGEALFMLVKGIYTLNPNNDLSEIYEKYHDKDGFLYIVYSSENTLGSNF